MLAENMEKTLNAFKARLIKIRTGRASASMLDSILVDYYGSLLPISQVGSITIPEAKLIVIDPWEKSMLDVIYRAIAKSDLGFNPSNDGNILRINIQPLTEERRKDLVKKAKQELEECKVSLRSLRQGANSAIKNLDISDDQKRAEEKKVQTVFDQYTLKAEAIFKEKEKDILTI